MRMQRLSTCPTIIAPVNAAVCMGLGTMAINGVLRAASCAHDIGRPQDGALAGMLGGIPVGLGFDLSTKFVQPPWLGAAVKRAIWRQATLVAAITGGLVGGFLGGMMVGTGHPLRPPQDDDALRAGAAGLACIGLCMIGLWPVLHYVVLWRASRIGGPPAAQPTAEPSATEAAELV